MNTPAQLQMPLIYDEEIGSIQDSSGLSLFITDELTEKRAGNDLHKIGQWMVDFINEAHERDSAPALEVGARYLSMDQGYAIVDWIDYANDIVTYSFFLKGADAAFGLLRSTENFRQNYPTKLPAESQEGGE